MCGNSTGSGERPHPRTGRSPQRLDQRVAVQGPPAHAREDQRIGRAVRICSHALEHGHSRIRQRHPTAAPFIRDAGTHHSRALRSTSPHCLSPPCERHPAGGIENARAVRLEPSHHVQRVSHTALHAGAAVADRLHGQLRPRSRSTGRTSLSRPRRAENRQVGVERLVFGGDANGRFRAFDHETGEVLWEINLGSPLTGFPITFAVDGRQYVAASTGVGGQPVGVPRADPGDPAELREQPLRVRFAGVSVRRGRVAGSKALHSLGLVQRSLGRIPS